MEYLSTNFYPTEFARVAEVVDALDLGSSGSNTVRVQVPPLAFYFNLLLQQLKKFGATENAHLQMLLNLYTSVGPI